MTETKANGKEGLSGELFSLRDGRGGVKAQRWKRQVEVGGWLEVRGWKLEVGKARSSKVKEGCWKRLVEARGCRLEVGSWRLEVRGWKVEVGRWKLEDGGWKLDWDGVSQCRFFTT